MADLAVLLLPNQGHLCHIGYVPLAHLYSSTRLEIVRERAPLPYKPMLLRRSRQSNSLPHLRIHQSLQSIGMGYSDLIDGNWPHETIDGILLELLQLLRVFELCAVPAAKAFDGLFQNGWYWPVVDMEPLIGELAFL